MIGFYHIGMLTALLFIHFFADFIVQTKWQQENKYDNNIALLTHISTYTLAWAPIVWVVTHDVASLIGFCGWTFVLHGITDSISSIYTHKAFVDQQDYRKGFQLVFLDQIAHLIQLAVCWKLFIQQ